MSIGTAPRAAGRRAAAAALLLAATLPSHSRTLEVGPGKTYSAPSKAAAAVQNGDTVLIDPGVYAGDVTSWSRDNLVLKGRSAYAHMRADGKHAGGKGIWVIGGKNTTVENIEFSGAKVPDENGAGIRQDGPGLTVRNCYFHDNENGILGGAGEVLIEHSEFANNGFGDGYTHNMYIDGATDTFTLRFCVSRLAKIGHLVKTRAKVNYILYNRIMDEAAGTSSYQIDMPNGGAGYLIGNVIQQGPNNDNPILVAFAMEGNSNPRKELYLVGNTMVNDHGSGTFVSWAGTPTVKAWNNIFAGPGKALSGTGDTSANLVSQNPGFVDRAKYDYRLAAGSPAIDKGKDPGAVGDYSLMPAFQPAPNPASTARKVEGALDIGAYELGSQSGVKGRLGAAGRANGAHAKVLLEGEALPEEFSDALGRGEAPAAAGVYFRDGKVP